MASLSFRDRFFTPPVAHALTSPTGILALGAGAALGIVATLGTGGLAGPIVGGVVGGLLGYGGRVALAIPKKQQGPRIDPFGVKEPWRHAVADALKARARYTDALQSFRAGPMRDTLEEIASRLDEATEECWNIAKQGQAIADARRQIDDAEIRWELDQARMQSPPGTQATGTQERTIDALEAQLASGARMDALIASTVAELNLINARLDQTVTQAIELSVSNRTTSVGPLGDSVEAIVDDLTSLHQAMTSMEPPPVDLSGPGSRTDARNDDRTEPPGQVQGSAGS